ncbi:hypothetical protein AB0H43_03080 [Hamadaea sp. NPDC050747]|uniref:hypothetical protein n=1 Tax=Hamadaea sp. NPDC050747 TaxID=3155789 RepID=UPI0033F34169
MSDLPDDAEIFVRVKDLRGLFDRLVDSMDFGSGFLDIEDVETLRRVAVVLGVDPMAATPSEFAAGYRHEFRAQDLISEERYTRFWDPARLAAENTRRAGTCRTCSRGKDADCHGD